MSKDECRINDEARMTNRPASGGVHPRRVLHGVAGTVRARAADILRRMHGRPGHIMNLGHGILPETPIASVEALIETVHTFDQSMAGAAS